MKSGGKDYKKFFVILLIGLFLVTLVSPTVFAQESPQLAPDDGVFVTLWKAFFGGIFNGNSSWIGKNQDDITRILLIILVALLVYSVSDFLPFTQDKEYVKWAVAVVVALLAFLFIEKETLGGIVDTYGALGVALTSVIPLLILLAFTFKLHDNPKFIGWADFIEKFMFILFGLWMVLQWQNRLREPFVQAYLGSAIVAFVWVFAGPWIRKKWEGRKAKEGVDYSTKRNLEVALAANEREQKIITEKLAGGHYSGAGKKAALRTLHELKDGENTLLKELSDL